MKKRTWAHLAPPRLTVAPPGTKTYTNQPKTRLGTRKPGKKRRRPKTFQEHPTLAEVFHRGSHVVRSLPQKHSLRGAASRSLPQQLPAASKFPQRGGLGEAHLDLFFAEFRKMSYTPSAMPEAWGVGYILRLRPCRRPPPPEIVASLLAARLRLENLLRFLIILEAF